MLSRLSIFSKMLIIPGLALIFFSSYMFYAYYQQQISSSYLQHIQSKHFPAIEISNQNIVLLQGMIKTFNDAVGARESSWLYDAKLLYQKIKTNLNDLNKVQIISDDNSAKIMQDHLDDYYYSAKELSDLLIKDNTQNLSRIEKLTIKLSESLKKMQQVFHQYHKEQRAVFVATIENTNLHNQKVIQMGFVFGSFSLILMLLITIFLALSTRKSILELLKSVIAMADGKPDFKQRLVQKNEDEMGLLVKQFNRFTDKLEQDNLELIQAKQKADNANRAKSEFLANMSHEIRTPLNAVVGFSELMEQTEISRKQKTYLQSIKSGARTLLSIINDILDLSRIEADKLIIQYEPCLIQTLLNDMKNMFEPEAVNKRLTMQLSLQKDLPECVLLDEPRLKQILFNLLGNAIKFTHQGNININVRFNPHENNQQISLWIEVIDTGIGIAEDQLQIIFEKFVQQNGQSNRQYGGTGLGLAISKKLIQLMNGSINVSSSSGNGSIFSIYFDGVDICNKSHILPSTITNSIQNIKFEPAMILVVDDDESNRQLMINALSGHGIDVVVANNGEQALKIMKKIRPDLVFMDLCMPVMDGMETITAVKKNAKLCNIPVIALTDSLSLETSASTMSLFNDHMTKPISLKDLFARLQYYLKPINTTILETTDNRASIQSLLTNTDASVLKEIEKIEELWKRATQSGLFDDTRVFSSAVDDIGKKYDLPLLMQYAADIQKSVDEFDVQQLEKLLDEFANLLIMWKKINNESE